MVRQIVVPMDGSELAERALPLAAGLARRWSAPLALVRVHIPVVPLEYRGEVSALDWWLEETRRAELAYLRRTGSERAENKRREHEDWIVLLAFNHLFAGLEAFVSAHLADFPGDLRFQAHPGGLGASLSVPIRIQ
jgi:nucleotide-binding universal stress UspA family protein